MNHASIVVTWSTSSRSWRSLRTSVPWTNRSLSSRHTAITRTPAGAASINERAVSAVAAAATARTAIP
ncbi:hypothetical protein OV079_32215 [Nannocystis pusilla]|uniref:Uncharacterized protein n=1 Tax=Nannocystis pusilla TaxID=889268 RepID=A0A9X3J028_9BACT|nr:hypothetical protein [Nannocystis pusilla]MCY1010151.1 hypothetical protein [Nannocystis pusilla]